MPVSLPTITAAPAALLSQVGLGVALSVHLALGGLLLAGLLTVSVALFWRRDDAGARHLASRLATYLLPTRAFTLLLLLTAALPALLAQAAYRPDFSVLWWLPGLVLIAIGLLGGEAWRQRLPVADAGEVLLQGLALGAVFFLLGGYFYLFCMLSLVFMPGSWPVLGAMPYLLPSWSALFAWKQFLCLSLALCGALLLPAGHGAESVVEDDEERSRLRLATALLGVFLVLLPLPLVLELLVLPGPALSIAALVTAALRLALAALILIALLLFRVAPRLHRLRPVVVTGLLLLFALFAVQGELHRGQALAEHVPARAIGLAPTLVPVLGAEGMLAQEAPETQAPGTSLVERGREVFEQSCRACHAFDRRQVGPPLLAVLPKYAESPEKLRAFIADPVPVDPDYAPMPRLGLAAADIEAVSAYLLHRLREQGEEGRP